MKKLRQFATGTCLLLPFLLIGQAGTLDTDFNTLGYLITGSIAVPDHAKSVTIQADGKIVTAGFTGTNSAANFDLYRFLDDGSWDPTFDGDGRVTTDIAGDKDAAWGVVVQPDGKLVVAGFAFTFTQRFAVARYNSDGSLDNSFATQGISTANFFGQNDQALAVALQPDGKIVAAGLSKQSTDDNDFAVGRWKTNGTLDSSFSVQGTLIVDVGTEKGAVRSVVVQPDGKILLGGYSQNASNWAMQLVRLNSDGTLDNTFNGNGKLRIEINSVDDACLDLALQPDGKIIAIGYSSVNGQYDAALVRINSDGTLDNSFSGDGMTTIAVGAGADVLRSGYLLNDGRIVCAGTSEVNLTGFDPLVMRVNSDGTLDNSFGTNGWTTSSIGFDTEDINACAPDANGNIIAAGYQVISGTSDAQVLVLRYLNQLDIGIVEHGITSNTMVYPNPLGDVAHLAFELLEGSKVSIELLDLQGRLIHTFQRNAYTTVGAQQVQLDLPDALNSGQYFVKVSTETGSTTVRVVK